LIDLDLAPSDACLKPTGIQIAQASALSAF